MKRPRESTHSSCGENDVPRSQLEGEVTCESLFPLVFASSHRDQRSRQHRCGSQRRSSFLPRNFLVGACFIAALALSSLPEAHALSSTRNIANVNSATSFEDVVFRRIEETKEAENESSNPEECTVPAGKCTQCTFSEQKTYEACKETGKWQEFKCFLPGENTGSEDEDVKFEMRSCKYTDLDNGLAMVGTNNSRRKRKWSGEVDGGVCVIFPSLYAMSKHCLTDSIFFFGSTRHLNDEK